MFYVHNPRTLPAIATFESPLQFDILFWYWLATGVSFNDYALINVIWGLSATYFLIIGSLVSSDQDLVRIFLTSLCCMVKFV